MPPKPKKLPAPSSVMPAERKPPPPPNWQLLAKNHLGGRSWSSIRQTWGTAALGFDLDEIQDLSLALDPILRPNFDDREKVSVFSFPGGRIAAFGDAVSASVKAAYVLRGAGNCLLGGQPTWAAIDAYHFSFVAARALLGLLGVHLVHVHDTFAALDVFPEGETQRAQTEFSRQYRNYTDPARLIYRKRSDTIAQRDIWVILVRILRVTTFDAAIQPSIDLIIELGAGFSSARNDVLYQNIAWLYKEDYITPTIPDVINDDPFILAATDRFFEEKDSSFAFAMLMLKVMRSLITSIETIGGSNIIPTSYGECFRSFSGFDQTKLHPVYSVIYRQEGFGSAL
ncbi:hypothetical protein [Methylobacterium sp. Leaf117]|uniref:hypothetical protein n=1 Tax=Methylobacterium sp. Leaf117 TaxID=1736260 RepID=UPI000AFA0D78|nr:hypothetical protein [Methylobacterium sp. Leaf117]